MELINKKKENKEAPIFKKFLYNKYKKILGNVFIQRRQKSNRILKGSEKERRIFNNLKLFYHEKKGLGILEYALEKIEKKGEKEIKETKKIKPKKFLKFNSLGKGAFGECFLIRSLDDEEEYAAKIVDKSKLDKERAKKSIIDEIKRQQQMKYPKIVKVKDFFENKEKVFIILEFCKNQTLSDLLKRRHYLTEIEVRCYIFQLIQGLKYIHNQKIIHRDLKPNNILLDEKLELKIGDFGLIAVLNKVTDRKKTICGTRNFMAPEVYQPGEKGYSFEVDIWSMGVIMYNLLTGDLPFKDDDPKELEKKILNGEFSFPATPVLSNSAKDLIKQILVTNPKKRPGLNQILFHDFFHIGTFPRYLKDYTLKRPPSKKEIEFYTPNADENGIDNREVIQKKLYNLIVKDIPEVRYEDIENYSLDIKPTETFDYFISYLHKSHHGFCYYEINNGLIGIIFQNENNENQYNEYKMILNEKINKIYIIKTDYENEKDEINIYDEKNCSEELKKKLEEFLNYRKIIKEKQSTNSISSINSEQNSKSEKEDLSSIHFEENSQTTIINESENNDKNNQSSRESIKDFINEIKTESINEPISESISEIKIPIKEIPIIYIKYLMVEKHGIFILLSNNDKQIIFHDKNDILLSDKRGIVGYLNRKKELTVVPMSNILRNPNHNFSKRLKYIRQVSFTNMKEKLNKKMEKKKAEQNNITDETNSEE